MRTYICNPFTVVLGLSGLDIVHKRLKTSSLPPSMESQGVGTEESLCVQ